MVLNIFCQISNSAKYNIKKDKWHYYVIESVSMVNQSTFISVLQYIVFKFKFIIYYYLNYEKFS